MPDPIPPPASFAPPSVSVVVLTRDRLERLGRCLEALVPQLGRAEASPDEILVVDTGSRDGTPEAIAARALPGVVVHRFAGPGSWAEARNFGIDQARGELIAFLDDDCVPASDWIARGRAAFADAPAAWRPLDALGGLVAPPPSLAFPDWWDPEMAWLVGLSVPGHLGPEAGRYFYPYTSNLWLRASVARAERFQTLGGAFGGENPTAYAAGREDAELWRRLRVTGRRTAFDPALVVEHHIDAARLDLEYLKERARRDGAAWAAREGRAEDMPEVAYAVHAAGHPRDLPEEPHARRARLRFHQIMRERHRSALHALAEKTIVADPRHAADRPTAFRVATSALISAGARFALHRAKDAARRTVHAFSPPRRAAPPSAPPIRIAIVASAYLGDLVILQGVVRGLLEAHPDLEIHLLAPGPAQLVFRGFATDHPGFRIRPFEARERSRELLRRELVEFLDGAQPQIVFGPYLHGPMGEETVRLLHALPRCAPLVAFTGDMELRRQLDRDRIALPVPKRLDRHESENLVALFEAGGLRCEARPARIELECDEPGESDAPPGPATARALAALRALDYVAINPDAGKPEKEWEMDRWAEVIARMSAAGFGRFVVNLSAGRGEDREGELRRAVAIRLAELREESAPATTAPWIFCLRSAPLHSLAATIACARALLTVDSGPQHLAHAFGTPSLTLYGPMDERRWADRARPDLHRTIRGGMFDLTPEELRGLPRDHLMRLIEPEAVVRAALEMPAFGAR